MNFGIEFEFFVQDKDGNIIPAYKATRNLDGNPSLGEIKTGVFDNIVDCVFDLKKRMFSEQKALMTKGFSMLFNVTSVFLDDKELKQMRADRDYINRKDLEVLEEFSIYPNGKTGKMLSRGNVKSSLQINISKNNSISYERKETQYIGTRRTTVDKPTTYSYSQLFNFINVLSSLDKAFAQEIKDAARVKGVYAIKSGEKGDRIEYRSLPSNVNLDKLIEVLS